MTLNNQPQNAFKLVKAIDVGIPLKNNLKSGKTKLCAKQVRRRIKRLEFFAIKLSAWYVLTPTEILNNQNHDVGIKKYWVCKSNLREIKPLKD